MSLINSLLVGIVILLFMIAVELSVISKNMVYFQRYWEKKKREEEGEMTQEEFLESLARRKP